MCVGGGGLEGKEHGKNHHIKGKIWGGEGGIQKYSLAKGSIVKNKKNQNLIFIKWDVNFRKNIILKNQ